MKNAFKTTLGALAIVAVSAVSAAAATLSGTFTVQVVNKTNLTSAQSQATRANFDTYFNAASDNVTKDTFTYTGALDFATFGGDSTTIAQWLASNVPGTEDINGTVGRLQLSKANINNGTATSTFFLFTLANLGATNFSIDHDDGIAVFDDGVRIGGNNGPTSQVTTAVNGFNGGKFELLYVATNSNPSVLRVSAVPVPAAGFLLLGALGGLAALRRRKAA